MVDNSFRSLFKVIMLVMLPFMVVMALRECHDLREEAERTSKNQDILLHNGEVEIGQTASGKHTASAQALNLRASDLRRKPDSLLAVTQKELGIKNSRMMAVARASSSAMVDVRAAITTDSRDTSLLDAGPSTALKPAIRHVSWSDPWVRLDGIIKGDTFNAHIESRDTLQVIVHRVPRRFLFFRYGTRAVRMEVVSQNPHTRLSCPKLVFFSK